VSHCSHSQPAGHAVLLTCASLQWCCQASYLRSQHVSSHAGRLCSRMLSSTRPEHTDLLCAQRFPQWMWRNRSVERFVAWLRAHNLALPESDRTRRAAGLYGMGEGPIQS